MQSPPDRFAFNEVVASYRHWLGWSPAVEVRIPVWLMDAMFQLGDFAGWLGWRPPLRKTVQKEVFRGAIGNSARWTSMTGIIPRSLEQSLNENPASVQERWFSKLYVLKPVALGVLSLFWIATALISLGPGWRGGIALLNEAGIGTSAASIVIAGALADLYIGIGIAFRRIARPALYAGLGLSILYVAMGTILLPQLWIDPLGPLMKVWPILLLHLVALSILEDR